MPESKPAPYAATGWNAPIAPESRQRRSLAPSRSWRPEGSNPRPRPACAGVGAHVIGQPRPDVVAGRAADHALSGHRFRPRGRRRLEHPIQRPGCETRTAACPAREVLMFNSGGTGARPGLDRLSATAFPSGVYTMSSRRPRRWGRSRSGEGLRPGSAGAGESRGARPDHRDRAEPGLRNLVQRHVRPVDHPARGPDGGVAARRAG